jgi:hypothetical protein
MILYNVTCLVEPQIEVEWLKWMKEEHLPEVMATGKFSSCRMFRIDPHADGDSGTSFAIQYFASSREDFDAYVSDHAPTLMAKTAAKYGGKMHAFRTVMEEV